jgi:hypothetical protein
MALQAADCLNYFGCFLWLKLWVVGFGALVGTQNVCPFYRTRGALFQALRARLRSALSPAGQYVLFSGIRILLVGGRKSITAYAETFDRLLASRGEGHRNRQLRVARFLPTLQAGYQ